MKRSTFRALFIIGAGLSLVLFQNFESIETAPSSALRAKNCFIRDDLSRQHYAVSIFAQPAVRGFWPESSPYYPGNVFSGRPSIAAPPLPSGEKAPSLHQLWANRCHFISRSSQPDHLTPSENDCKKLPNVVSAGNESLGVHGRQVIFSTYKKANACTVIQARRLVSNESDRQLAAVAARFGLEFLPKQDKMESYWDQYKETVSIENSKGDLVRGEFLVDKCISPTFGPSPADGISLDYEVADWRKTNTAWALFGSLRKVTQSHNKKLYVFTNPLTVQANAYGIDRNNFRRILPLVDMFSINLATGAAKGFEGNEKLGMPPRPDRPAVRTHLESYDLILSELEQTRAGRVPFLVEEQRKMMWGVGLFYTNLDDARRIQKKLFQENSYGGVAIQRAFVPQGGACDRTEQHLDKTVQINQVIACLSMGRCNGDFGK